MYLSTNGFLRLLKRIDPASERLWSNMARPAWLLLQTSLCSANTHTIHDGEHRAVRAQAFAN
jgi:hypothetical protein